MCTEIGELISFSALTLRSTKTYLQKPGTDGYNMLHVACLYGHVHIVASLIHLGCNVNTLHDANTTAEPSGMPPLAIASASGHIEVVACLFANNADVNIVDYKGVNIRHLLNIQIFYNWLHSDLIYVYLF